MREGDQGFDTTFPGRAINVGVVEQPPMTPDDQKVTDEFAEQAGEKPGADKETRKEVGAVLGNEETGFQDGLGNWRERDDRCF